MLKLLRLTAKEAEKLLLKAGFKLIRSKRSHRIYAKEDIRFILPYHTGKVLHPSQNSKATSLYHKSKTGQLKSHHYL